MLKIRLQRIGRRNAPQYRLVLMDARVKRQGRFLENLGHYDPGAKEETKVSVDLERVKHWIGQGAQATEPVTSLLRERGLNLARLHADKQAARKKAVAARTPAAKK